MGAVGQRDGPAALPTGKSSGIHFTGGWEVPRAGLEEVKAESLQAWSSPEGSRKLKFPDFMTTAQEGGKVVRPTHRLHLPPGNSPGTHFC